ncbi:30S ribosome-binding factor RbfA, partial [Alienimonas chondri]|uniref:30S ribosome-binding factor RbfA n=1 Tax=Alienimonas chondri TaxID=2681879 RepID=UPI0014889F6E
MAKSRKLAKLNRAVREVVSTQVLFRIRDPRVRGVTVLDADVAPDGRTAKVYVSVLGDEAAEDRAIEGLESAKGFFQAKIAERLETRYTPVLTFVADGGVKRSIEISRSLQEATGRSLAEPDPPAPEPFDFKSENAGEANADDTDEEQADGVSDGSTATPRDAFALPDPTSPMEPAPAPDRPDGEYTPP